MHADRSWVRRAIALLHDEERDCPSTPLLRLPLPGPPGVDVYLKDERALPSGSLKHRLARSLFLHGLASGNIRRDTHLVDGSSGSTAISEAYFARLLELPYTAVIAAGTSPAKVDLLLAHGARVETAPTAGDLTRRARELGSRPGSFHLDQFGLAAVATDWRSARSLPGEILSQLREERHPSPRWFVTGAGTGGTSATIARHLRFAGASGRVLVVDPDGSAYEPAWREGRLDVTGTASRIEGIGRPRVEASFLPSAIDRVEHVADDESIAAMRLLRDEFDIDAGPSTGTNLVGALRTASRMARRGQRGSIVTIVCDPGERYRDTYGDAEWIRERRFDPEAGARRLDALLPELLSAVG